MERKRPKSEWPLAPLWHRVGSVLRRVRGLFPLTGLGILVGGAAVVVYFGFARPRLDYVLQLVALLAAGLTLLALVFVVPAAFLVYRAARRGLLLLDRPRFELEAERGYAVGLEMPRWRLLPLVELSWTLEDAPGLSLRIEPQGGRLVEQLEGLERMSVPKLTRRFVVEDAFGLARLDFALTDPRPVLVRPYVGRLSGLPMLRAHASGEEVPYPMGEAVGDRVDMRRYVAGDPLRLMLWKVYARTGELMVRTPERAVSPAVRIVAYLPSAPADEPAAAAARVAVDSGVFGRHWAFFADGAARGVERAEAAQDLIVESRHARDQGLGQGRGLRALLQELPDGDRVRLVLFLPAEPGPWLDTVAAELRRFPGAKSAVVVSDGLKETDGERRRLSWLRAPALEAAPRSPAEPEGLHRVVSTLAALGADVVVLDRISGRSLPVGSAPARKVAS